MRLLCLVLAMMVACSERESSPLRVGAAAVMRHAMPELVAAFERSTGTRVAVLYGASDRMAAAAVDALVVADGSLLPAKGRAIAMTSLVLVGPESSPHRFATLRDAGVVAIGDPAAVPVGRYAKQYLEQLGAWTPVSSRLVLGADVAAVLALAGQQTADVAIVYAADARDVAPLRVLDRAGDGPRIELVAGAIRDARGAQAFVDYLATPAARAILARHGFEF